MSSFRESAKKAMLSIEKLPPENIVAILREEYPQATLEEAERVRQNIVALFKASTKEDQDRLEKEHRAIHAELEKKYKKSGK